MKTNEKKALATATVTELEKKAADLRKQLNEELMKRQSTTVKNVRTIKTLRDRLAVVLTFMRVKSMSAER
jgi:ribosomal protein L29